MDEVPGDSNGESCFDFVIKFAEFVETEFRQRERDEIYA